MLQCNDIIALSESLTDINFDSDLCNFTCNNFYGKFRQRNAKRNSGGTVLYIRDSILPGVSIVKNKYDTLIWLKLDKTFFSFQTDTSAAYTYGQTIHQLQELLILTFLMSYQKMFCILSN